MYLITRAKRMQYLSNIYIIRDPRNPQPAENRGKSRKNGISAENRGKAENARKNAEFKNCNHGTIDFVC